MEFSSFDLLAVLLGLVALFGYINHKLFCLPHSIGLMVIAPLAALVLIGVELVFPATNLAFKTHANLLRMWADV